MKKAKLRKLIEEVLEEKLRLDTIEYNQQGVLVNSKTQVIRVDAGDNGQVIS